MATIYVTGHRNPDTDSIASAIAYAELEGRLDPRNEYVPVRLGDLNAQTRWVLDRSGAAEPEFLAHVLLRVRDVMQAGFPTASHREPIRQVGLTMARHDLELMPVVDDDGALAGVMTERTLARRCIRESREVTSLADAAAIASRDAKEYTVGDRQSLVIAQIETVGEAVLERRDELLEELAELRAARGLLLYALMVTDIMAKGTKMLVAGDHGLVERIFGQQVVDGTIDLPGVMSRKKQVAPKLMAAL